MLSLRLSYWKGFPLNGLVQIAVVESLSSLSNLLRLHQSPSWRYEFIVMLDPEKTREREALPKRICELDQELAQDQREPWEWQKRREAHLSP